MTRYFCQPELEKLDIFAELELELELEITELELTELEFLKNDVMFAMTPQAV